MNNFREKMIAVVILMIVCRPLLADWCSGNKFLVLEMPMSERVETAGFNP